MVDAITYEDIHELLRNEKNNADLQSLDREILDNVKEYLKAKNLLLEQQPKDIFSDVKQRAKILTEIDNAKQVLNDLFEKRERKIINAALYTVRTNSKLKDTTNMLASEEELYKSFIKLLSEDRAKFIQLVDPSPLIDKVDQSTEKESKIKKVKLLANTPELIDSELKKYGPYKKGDEAELCCELAELLIKQAKAQAI